MTTTRTLRLPVIIESPFAGRGNSINSAKVDAVENLEYAQTCLRDSILRGEAPFASHLLYTQEGVLNDDDTGERKIGIECGTVWRSYAITTIFYTDRSWSPGMMQALYHVLEIRQSYLLRSLHRTPMLPDGMDVDVLKRIAECVDTTPPNRFLFRS